MKLIKKIAFAFLTCLLVFTSCCEKQNAEKPKGTISYKRADTLQREYIKTRANFLNEYLNGTNFFEMIDKKGLVNNREEITEDTRDVTFDLEVLKQYIAYVEKEAKKQGLKGLGLRVYLGAYPKDDTTPNVKHPGFTTMFFMPTHQSKPKSSNTSEFFYWFEDEIIDGIDGLNFGSMGKPPKDLY